MSGSRYFSANFSKVKSSILIVSIRRLNQRNILTGSDNPRGTAKQHPGVSLRDLLLTCLACLLALRNLVTVCPQKKLFETKKCSEWRDLISATLHKTHCRKTSCVSPDAVLAELEWVAVWRSEMAKKSTFAPMVCPYDSFHEVEDCPVAQLCTM